jgi:hypothetical protein
MQYGTLAQIHSTDFHEKWILHRAGHEEEFLAAPEASTLTDYGASYENIEAMQPFRLTRARSSPSLWLLQCQLFRRSWHRYPWQLC